MGPCYIDIRRRNVVFTTNERTIRMKEIRILVETRFRGSCNALFKMADSLKTLKDSIIFSIILYVRFSLFQKDLFIQII